MRESSRLNGRKGGIKKGYKYPDTVKKDLERELLRQQVIAEREAMTRAQIARANCFSYMVLRHPDGSYTRATIEAELDRALAACSQAIEIWTTLRRVAKRRRDHILREIELRRR